MRNKKLNSKGFTLIELLIVIIIIGILAAIAFVAYSGSQTKAHQADAQSTLAEARNKLTEYNADKDNYPANLGDFTTWLKSSDGGNNTSLGDKLSNANGYSYTAGPADCDNDTTPCVSYSMTAAKSGTKGSEDITVTN